MNSLKELIDKDKDIIDLRSELCNHPLYLELFDLDNLRSFTEFHVFSVWDFMSLLMSLRQELCTSQGQIWLPNKDTQIVRLINEIVLDEESDVDASGKAVSHFEMYKAAMKMLSADTKAIDSFIASLKSKFTIEQALENPLIPQAAKVYVASTFKIIQNSDSHSLAAAFAFGRESLVPDIFRSLLEKLKEYPESKYLIEYFNKHVEIDDGKHKHLAYDMVESLCENDNNKMQEALAVTKDCLEARLKFWNDILNHLMQKKQSTVLK